MLGGKIRRSTLYWAILTALAFALAVWAYYRSTRSYLPCPDGHCPDPGTREYLHAVAVRAESAPIVSITIFAAVLILGGLGFGLFALLRQAPARVISTSTLDELPLDRIERVTFYKRDELVTDLICCEIAIGGRTVSFHEEEEGWDTLLRHLERLPGFRRDWYESVVKPAFAPCETLAYRRDPQGDASG